MIARSAAALIAALLVLTTGVASADGGLSQELRERVQADALGSDVTVHVAGGDASVFAYKADERQLPASTMKVVTAATALSALGADHRFATRVVAGDDPETILIVGGGDPLLAASDLQRLAARTAKALKKDGVASVDLRVDDYLFPRPSEAAGWAPGDSPTYAAPVRPLALLGEYSTNTTMTAVAVFAEGLRAKGISTRFGGRALAGEDADLIASFDGNTAAEAIELMLRVSENNVAETLFRHVALAQGYPATWSGSSAAAREVLQGLGMRTWRLELVDGSGLSQDDRLTARSLTQVLDLVIDPAHPEMAPILDWLPVAGRTGTLTYRFNGEATCARDKVFAKTGSLTGVSTLAGLTRDEEGEWLSFAVMVNRAPGGFAPGSTSVAIDTIAATVNGCA